MTEFSLRALARETWDELGGCDYHVLAKELLRRVPQKDRQAALDEALVAYARQFTIGLRPAARRRKGAGQANSARSWKVTGVRREWPQLRARIFTRDGQKPIGDCTVADLLFHADLLDTKARENQRKAAWERDLAGAVKAHEVKRVRDLPDDVLAQFLTPEAAA